MENFLHRKTEKKIALRLLRRPSFIMPYNFLGINPSFLEAVYMQEDNIDGTYC